MRQNKSSRCSKYFFCLMGQTLDRSRQTDCWSARKRGERVNDNTGCTHPREQIPTNCWRNVFFFISENVHSSHHRSGSSIRRSSSSSSCSAFFSFFSLSLILVEVVVYKTAYTRGCCDCHCTTARVNPRIKEVVGALYYRFYLLSSPRAY